MLNSFLLDNALNFKFLMNVTLMQYGPSYVTQIITINFFGMLSVSKSMKSKQNGSELRTLLENDPHGVDVVESGKKSACSLSVELSKRF